MDRRPPRTGFPLLDNVLAILWVLLAWVQWISVQQFSDIAVGLAGIATAVLTALRIYQHLMDETVSTTLVDAFSGDGDSN